MQDRVRYKGALFPNDKQGVETRPDLTGEITIEGRRWRLSAWRNISERTRKPWLKLHAEPWVDRRPQGNEGMQPSIPRPDYDSDFDDKDIPF